MGLFRSRKFTLLNFKKINPKEMLTVTVEILKRNVALETVLNRTARALGNLAMDADGSALIHSAGNSAVSHCITFSFADFKA